jgi:signal transduction histidine kinase
MRQPVASILLLADAALSDASAPSAVRASLGQIRAEAEWLGDLLQNVLESRGARAAAGEAQDLIRITSGVVTAAQATYPGHLRLQWREGDMSVAGSAIDLRRAITNLVSNATRAAGPGGTVVIELRRVDDRVLLTVDDDGPGFGLIRRGNGIGLQAAAQCLERHGGHIEHRRSPMGGTRATLMLWARGP